MAEASNQHNYEEILSSSKDHNLRKIAPDFIREFSKESSKEERQQLAQEIKAERSEYFDSKKEIVYEHDTLSEERAKEKEKSEKLLIELTALQEKIEELDETLPSRFMNLFQLRALRAELEETGSEHRGAEEKLSDIEFRLAKLNLILDDPSIPEELRECNNKLVNFYKDQEEKWAESDYTKEDIQKYFSEEHLSQLTVEEYTLLWKRFPNNAVTHVTRQGIRDHVGHYLHTSGVNRFWNKFEDICNERKIKSVFGKFFTDEWKEKSVSEFLKKRGYLSLDSPEEEVLAALEKGITSWGEDIYADHLAVHFASDFVADAYYGAERENEIFFVFPATFIASQFYFQGDLTDNNNGAGGWNDKWIWDKESQGVDINTGIVFIPKDTMVDPETGSRYTVVDGSAVIDESLLKNVDDFVQSEDYKDMIDASLEIIEKFSKTKSMKINNPYQTETIAEIDKRKTEIDNFDGYFGELFSALEPYRKKLADQGIGDQYLQYFILENLLGNKFDDWDVNDTSEKLRKHGFLYKKPENTVSAERFWENYFQENSSKKPSKIVYYEGGDPSDTLKRWLEEKGIKKSYKKEEEREHLGFPENKTDKDTLPGLEESKKRFFTLAREIVKKEYEKTLVAS